MPHNPFPRARTHPFQEEQNEFSGSALRGPAGTVEGLRAQNNYRGANPGVPSQFKDPALEVFLRALQRKAWFQEVHFPYTSTPSLALAQSERTYFLIQNLSTAETIYLGFGQQPGLLSGLQILPGGYYEPFQVPQNDIYIIGSGSGNALILYANVN